MTRPQTVAPPRQPGPAVSGPGRFMAGGMPVEKSLNFRGSSMRLLRMLRPERPLIVAILMFGIVSVALSVLGPKLLGKATDLIFAGVIGGRFQAGVSKAQAVAQLRAQGNDNLASLLNAVNFVPGQSIDFNAVGRVLLIVLILYVAASMFALFQARLTTVVVQRVVFRLREQVEAKLSRLPLSYFDKQQRGEVLSRATNDTDNIAQTLQQTLSQIVTSLLTIVGVLGMMFWTSPLLAIIALVTVPLSIVVATRIGKRAQPQFINQWATTGRLNGHIEEMYTGHSVVKAFGRQQEAIDVFAEHNEKLYGSSFKAQLISGIIPPAMMFIGNINYVLVAVVGGLRVASGAISLGDVQAFIQYSRQFSQPITQVASMSNLLQSGIASAERVVPLLDEPEQIADPAVPARPTPVRGAVAFENVSFRYAPYRPLIENLSLTANPGHTVAIVGPTGAGKTTLVNLLMRVYEINEGRITLDGVDIATMSRDELRENIGMVLQDTWLFGGTIAENIAYGYAKGSASGPPDGPPDRTQGDAKGSASGPPDGPPDRTQSADEPTQEKIVEAAQAAHVDRFVRTLPDGYD